MAGPMLAVRDLEVVYPGGVRAVKGASLDVNEGEIVTLFPDFGDKYLSTNLWAGWNAR